MLIINLAFLDFLMMLKIPHFLFSSFHERLLGYIIGCNFSAGLGSLSGIGGAMTNAAIAYDRYR